MNMKQIQHGDVSVELRETIAIVTLARPAKRNALSDANDGQPRAGVFGAAHKRWRGRAVRQ